MYDFLLSEVWWMEAIISATITAIATIGVAYIAYNSKVKKILENTDSISKLHKTRREEHDSLSREHNSLSEQHSSLSKENSEIKSTCSSVKEIANKTADILNKINNQIVAENAKQEFRYNHLTENQKDMINGVKNGVDSFNAIQQELIKMNEKNRALQNEIRQLKSDLEWKNKRFDEICNERTSLQKENKDLHIELSCLQKNYNDLSSKYRELNNKPKINRTNEFYMEP